MLWKRLGFQPTFRPSISVRAGRFARRRLLCSDFAVEDRRPIQRIPKRIPKRYKAMHPDGCRYIEFPNTTAKKPQQNRAKASDSDPRLHSNHLHLQGFLKFQGVDGVQNGVQKSHPTEFPAHPAYSDTNSFFRQTGLWDLERRA